MEERKGQLRCGDSSNHFLTHLFIISSLHNVVSFSSNYQSIQVRSTPLTNDNDPMPNTHPSVVYLLKYQNPTDNPSTATGVTFFAISINPLFIPSDM